MIIRSKSTLFWVRALIFGAAFCLARSADAQTVWVSAASGNWNTAASWNPAVVPGVGTNASIVVAGTFTVTYDSPMSAASIASLTLGSSTSVPTLTIAAAGFNVVGTTTFVDNSSSAEVININSGGVMTNGTLAMTSRNSTVNVNSGGVMTNNFTKVADNGSVDDSSELKINSGAVVNLGAVTIGRHTQSSSLGLNISSGTVTARSIDIGSRNSYANMVVSGGNTTNSGSLRLGTGTPSSGREMRYRQTGGTVGNAGTVDMSVAASATTWFSVINANATFYADGIRIFPNSASSLVARFTNSGNIYLGASGFKVLNSGTYSVSLESNCVMAATADWGANVNIVTPAIGPITFKCADAANNAHNITLTNPISGSASVAKTGNGTLTFLGANTYSGSTTNSAGLLILGNASALPKGTALTIGGSGTSGTVDLAGASPQVGGLTSAGTAANQLITNSSASTTSTLTFSNSSASTTFGGVIAGGSRPIALTVLGGNLTLSGVNIYAGNIFISSGKLALSGAGSTFTGSQIVLSNSAAILNLTGMNDLSLDAGQSLAGFGAVTGNVTAANCPVTPGANGAGGTLAISGGLTLNGNVTNQFDLLLDPNAVGNDLIAVGGALNVSGTNSIKLNALAGSLLEGTYHLITCSSLGSGDTNNFQLTGSPGAGLQADISITSTGVDLIVTHAGGQERIWVGDGLNNYWDFVSTNWLNAGLPDVFANGNFVTFDDTSTNLVVNLITNFLPGSVAVASTNDYTFTGVGKISGGAVLIKTNSGTLTILTTNNYSSSTLIDQGTVRVGNGTISGSLGTGLVNDNGLLIMQQTGNGALSNAISGNGVLVQAGAGTLTLNGSNTLSGGILISNGTLQIGSGGTIGGGSVANNSALIFNNSASNVVANAISGTGTMTLSGSGTVALSGINTYAGNTTVNNGTLLVNGTNSGTGSVTVNSPCKLGGRGTIAGAVTINGGATLSPGVSPGTLTINSNLVLNSGAILTFELGTTSDKVVVGRNLILAGTLNVSDAGGLVDGTYTLFTYGDSLTINNLSLGTMPSGKSCGLDTNTPGQVKLVVGIQAFPGALGFGSLVTGGRGGSVYHVTTLADSGAGSFRDAVSGSGRIIVFDVGGYISLNSAVSAQGNLTIAGQTAPGGGIGFKGGEISFAGRANVICRYIRIRPGSDTASDTDDALSLYQAKNAIFDHCSFEFGPWNNIDGVGDSTHVITNITFQNCIIANPTYDASSPPPQGFGCHSESVGGTWSWFYNVFANSHNRNPLAKVNTVFINNVEYNCSAGYTTHTSTPFKHDLVNNYFIWGPGSGGNFPWYQIDDNQSMYFTGNLRDNSLDGVLNGSSTVPLPGYQGGGTILGSPWWSGTTNVPTYNQQTAYRLAVSRAGPLPRDDMDNLIISQMKTLGSGTTGTGAGTRGPDGGFYSSQTQTGLGNNGYGTITGGAAPLDTDGDALPDYWEIVLGLNTNSAADASSITLSGYTQLEVYLNWLAEPHAIGGINANLDIDLRQFCSGFTNVSPVYSVSNAVNGSVTLLLDGHTARYTPPANFTGRASFLFKVTGSDGSSMTNTIGLIVTGTAQPQNLTWRGDGTANVWDTVATNWLNGTSPAVFRAADGVTFDDTGSNSPAINLAAVLSPGALTVSATKNYTFGGTGVISGTIVLNKSGAGTLTVNTTNNYSGGTFISGGAVAMGNIGAVGSGAVQLSGGSLGLPPGDLTNAVSISGNGALLGNGSVNNTLKGAIDGSGVWTLNIPSGRVITEESDNSAFTGTIALTGSGVYRINSTTGLAWGNSNCIFDLGTNGVFNNRAPSSTNIHLGALTGDYGSQLRGSDQSGVFTDTIQVGALNLNSTFNGSMSDGTGATPHQLALSKNGTGTLTLNGTNTASGAIVVNSGGLMVNGVTGTGAVTVVTGTMLGGAGKIGGSLTAQSGATLSPGISAGSAGSLVVSNNLSLNGAILPFDLASVTTVGGGVNDLISLSGGSVNLSGVSTVVPNYLNGSLADATYTLINGGASTAGSAANLAWGGTGGTRQTFTFDLSTPGTVLLQVSGALSALLIWRGTNGNNWDTSTTNWLNGVAVDKFFNSDYVLFDDTSTNGNVVVVGTLQPGSITVSNDTLPYVFSGGALAGSASLQKSGASSLTLSASNSFSGGTMIQDGDIILANDTANQSGLGSGAVALSGGTLNMFNAASNAVSWNLIVPVATTGRLNVAPACDLYGSLTGSGTFNLFIPAQQTAFYGDWSAFGGQINIFTTTNGDFRLANFSGLSNAIVNLSNNVAAYFTVDPGTDTTIDIGMLSGIGSSRLLGITGDSTLTFRVGNRNTNAVFAGTIAEQATNTTTAIEKIGSGTWTLSGSNSYAGDTLVSAGTLLVNNTAGSGTGYGNLTIADGATLGGNGIIGSDTTINDGATLAPGNPIGTLTISNNLTLNDISILQFALGSNSDSVVVSGDLFLTGQLSVTNSDGFGVGTYTLFTYGGSLTFGQLVLASAPPGYNYSFDTNSPGIVNLVVASAAPPAPPNFTGSVMTGSDLILSGSNGVPLGNYYIIGSTDLTLPFGDWTRVMTNQFDSNGDFSCTISNAAGSPQNFYLLQLP